MNLRRILFIVLLNILVISSVANAQSYVDKHGAKIKSVYVNSGGELLITVEDVEGWLKLGKAGEPSADAMYSTALTAKISGKTIWLRYYPSESSHGVVGIVSIN